MSADYEYITIVGNVGREPEMRYTPSGTAVTSFTVAVNSKYNEEKLTKWFRVTTWGKQAEVCHQYVTKGMKVLIGGELQADKATGAPRIWEKKDGTSACNFEINAAKVVFLSGGKGKGEAEEKPEAPALPDGELPF